MKKTKLNIKDAVTIGVFAVIYFAVMFGIGMIGIVPILFLVYPMVLGLVSGTIVMLFMTKVQKAWGLLILGIIIPISMFIMGHTYIVPVHAFVVMLIAELIRKQGRYNSFVYNALAFAVFNTWSCASLMQMLWAKERYMELAMMMGEAYVKALERLITYPTMALVYIGAGIGGFIGAYIGKIFLKKHFIKAGIVS